MSRLPLSRIRVLDLTLIWAGPYAVMQLADLGAEIIRVESCQHHITNTRGFVPAPTKEIVESLGYLAGMYVDMDPGERPWNRFGFFNALGRNKLSMTTDMTRPEGLETVLELVKVCDVFIENNSLGLMKRFGLDYETVRRINPAIVYVTMPLHGLDGPYADYIGFGPNGEAMSGILSLRGYEGEDVTTAGQGNHMDAVSGIVAAYATMMALYQRDRTGRGQFVEVSQVEHLINQIGGPLMDAAMNGRVQAPTENRDPVRAPQGTYRCQGEDRWIAISVGTDEEWAGLCRVVGKSELADDASYAGNLARRRRHDEIDALITGWTSTQDARAAMGLLQQHGVPAGMVADDRDALEDPQLAQRGFFHEMRQADCGVHRYPGHSYQASETPLRFDLPPPLLGEHNDYVYRELLGRDEDEIRRLTELGHIGDRYVPGGG
ncbi:MAG: CoA transferase [Chloroflexi bacterium]|nr:CoA transferase [Chloroflexota bacterium]